MGITRYFWPKTSSFRYRLPGHQLFVRSSVRLWSVWLQFPIGDAIGSFGKAASIVFY